MTELYLILIPAVFALVIFFSRKSLLTRSLLVLAGFFHLGGTVYLLSSPTPSAAILKDWIASDLSSGIIIAVCSLLVRKSMF